MERTKVKTRRGTKTRTSKTGSRSLRKDLENSTVDQLRRKAKDLGIKLLGRLRKAQIVDTILKALTKARSASRVRKSSGRAGPVKAAPETGTGKKRSTRSARAAVAPAAPEPVLEEAAAAIEAPAVELPAAPEAPAARAELLALSPRRAFALWECDPRAVEAVRLEIGDPESAMVLRVHDVTLIEFDDRRSHSMFDVEVQAPAGNSYLEHLQPGRSYRAEIGVRARDGRFRPIARTACAGTPPEREASRPAETEELVRGAPPEEWEPRARPPARASAPAWAAAPRSAWEPTPAPRFPFEPGRAADAAVEVDAAGNLHASAPGRKGAPAGGDTGNDPGLHSIQAALLEVGASLGDETEGFETPPGRRGAAGVIGAAAAVASGPLAEAVPPEAASAPPAAERAVRPDLPTSPGEWPAGRAIGISSLGLHALVEGSPPFRPEEVEASGPGVHLELNADLVLYGRTEPGMALYVDGVRIPVRDDGTFDARFALGHPVRRQGSPGKKGEGSSPGPRQ